MKVEVYDFDKTIYNGDSSIDFFIFCLKKKHSIILCIPKILVYFLLYLVKLKSKKEVKKVFFSFLKKLNDVDLIIEEFWNINKSKIKKFYVNKPNHDRDIIISASPAFLLKPICLKFTIYDLISSKLDKHSAEFLGENCKGFEKVNRLKSKYKNVIVESIYTDSYSDQPLIDISNNAYIVRGNSIKKIK